MTFVREGQITLMDLMQPGFQPSRAVGPPMPDNPEETWLRGVAPAPEPESLPRAAVPVERFARGGQAAPVIQEHGLAPAPETGYTDMDVIFLEAAVARFGGKDLFLNADEIEHITRHLIDAYTRQQAEERFRLIVKYLQPQPVEGSEVYEPSGAGQEVVREVHRPQEEGDLSPEEMQELRDAMFGGQGEVREMQRDEQGADAPAPEARHGVSRKASRRKTKSS